MSTHPIPAPTCYCRYRNRDCTGTTHKFHCHPIQLSESPLNGHARVENKPLFWFSVPVDLSLKGSSPKLTEHLPPELIQLIALELHPVDRICLALTCRSLLRAIFSHPISAPERPVWSQFLATASSFQFCCCDGCHRRDSCSRTCISRPPIRHPRFVFAFNCTHPLDPESKPPEECQECRRNELEMNRSLGSQLMHGWRILRKEDWEYCSGCKRLRPADPLHWSPCMINGAVCFMLDVDPENLRWDGAIMECMHKKNWFYRCRQERLRWVMDNWQFKRRHSMKVESPTAGRKRTGSVETMAKTMKTEKDLLLCPDCLGHELSRCREHQRLFMHSPDRAKCKYCRV